MKLAEIAARILAHLKGFEADPTINAPRTKGGMTPYYLVNAWASGRYIGVRYVNFQGIWHLKRDEALAYLAWLDGGGVGWHCGHTGEAK